MAHYSRRRFEQDVPEVMVAAQTVTSIFVTLGQVMRERIGKFASVEVLNESNYSHIGSRHQCRSRVASPRAARDHRNTIACRELHNPNYFFCTGWESYRIRLA